MKLFKKYRGFVLTMCFLLIGQLAYSHVTRIRVKQNQNGSLTWYVQTYHSIGQCGINNSGITINGAAYPLQSEHSGSAPTSGTVIFADAGSNWPTYFNSYAVINTPYIAGSLNVQPYSSNVCWAFAVGGNGSFTPPPPPVCTTPPVTNVSNTLGAPNNNNTDCIVTDDSIPVTLNISHLACGNITGDGQLSVLYSDGTLIGNVAYQNGISTSYTFNLPQGKLAQLTIVDNDFPNNPFNYSITGLNGTSYTGATNITPITPVLSDVNGQCNVSVPVATTTDNCGGTINGTTSDPLSYSAQGQYTITWTFDAGNGNSTTATQNVTVKDTILPTITSPFDITTNVDANECGAYVTYGIPTANDNCGTGAPPTTLTNHTYKGDLNGHTYFLSNVKATPEVAHANAIAAGGHLATISDATENSFISGFIADFIWIGATDRDVEGQWKWITNEPMNYTNWSSGEPNNAGGAEDWAVINWGGVNNPSWNDWYFTQPAYYAIEFDGGTLPTTLVSGPASGGLFPVGTTTVTYEAVDPAGNRVETSFNVTVNDNIAPNVITQNITVELDANGNASITPAMIDSGSSDACGIASLSIDTSTFECSNVGENIVTLTGTDINGNTATTTAIVTIEDNEAPVINGSGGSTILNDPNGNGVFNSSDNTTSPLTASPSTYGTLGWFNSGNLRCFGNAAGNYSGAATFDGLFNINSNGTYSTAMTFSNGDVINNSTGSTGWGIISYLGAGTFNIGFRTISNHYGYMNITQDGSGITINNMVINPLVGEGIIVGNAGISDVTVNVDANECGALVTHNLTTVDNCSATLSYSPDSGSFFTVGTTTVTATATDASGNTASSTFDVTVIDNILPTAITQNVTVQLDANGVGLVTASQIDNGSFDNCDIEYIGFGAPVTIPSIIQPSHGINNNSGGHGQSFTATNDGTLTSVKILVNGNSSGRNVHFYNNGNGSGTAWSIGTPAYTESNVTLSDSAGGVIWSEINLSTPLPVIAGQQYSFIIEGNTDIYYGGNTYSEGQFLWGFDASSGCCNWGDIAFQLDFKKGQVINFDCSNIGENIVTLNVTDINGNFSSASANVTVEDNIAPTVITQSYSIDLANGVANITPSDIDGGTFDNCEFTLAIDRDAFSCDDIGDHTVTLTATDASGNTSSNTATVSILGDVPTIDINDFYAVQTQKVNTIFLGFGPQSINLSTVVTGGSGFTYEWTTSTGELVSNEASPSISPTVSTTYNVTVTNSNGCTASTSLYVCVIDARSFDKNGRYKGKVTVCHHTSGKKGTKHVEINISANAVMTHLTKHGYGTDHADSLGACDAVCVDNTNLRTAGNKVSATEEVSIEDNLLIYPNPSNGIFDIRLTAVNLQTDVFLFDMTGKLIDRKSISKEVSAENIITIGNYSLANGFYLLKIITKNETIVKKLIVEKSN